LLKRREEHVARQNGRIADLKKQAADAEAKLTRLYEAIENGLAELDGANLKGRIAELRRIRDAARADAERAEAGDRGRAEITSDILSRFAEAARRRIKRDDGQFQATLPANAGTARRSGNTRNPDKRIQDATIKGACKIWRKSWRGHFGARSSQLCSEVAPRAGFEPATNRLTANVYRATNRYMA
jgi:hypothetical protein